MEFEPVYAIDFQEIFLLLKLIIGFLGAIFGALIVLIFTKRWI